MSDPVTGAAVGEAMSQAGEDFLQRVLSTRQEERVATVLDLAAREVARRVENGQSIRDDGMFDGVNPDAVEVTEGALLAARDEHQQKKLPYMANLYASIVTNDEVTLDVANVAIRSAEELTWTEMCLLGMLTKSDVFPLPETDVSRTATGWDDWAVAQSFYSLRERDYIYLPYGEKTPHLGLSRIDTRMSAVKLNSHGSLVVGLMGLDTISTEDIRPIHALLLRAAARHAEKETGTGSPETAEPTGPRNDVADN